MTCDTAYITNNSSLYNISIDDFDASDVPIRQEELLGKEMIDNFVHKK